MNRLNHRDLIERSTPGLQSNISKIRWLRSELLSKRFSASQPCSSQPAGTNDRLVRVHVGGARRLDDVDGVDADARTDVARRCGVVPRHVDRDDGSDDAGILGADAVSATGHDEIESSESVEKPCWNVSTSQS